MSDDVGVHIKNSHVIAVKMASNLHGNGCAKDNKMNLRSRSVNKMISNSPEKSKFYLTNAKNY